MRRTKAAVRLSADIDKSIQRYSAASSAPDAREKQELLEDLHAQKAANESYRQECKDCMESIRAERLEQKIGNIKATDYSQAIGGYYNAAPELQERLSNRAWNIGDITTDGHSSAGGGVINNVDARRG